MKYKLIASDMDGTLLNSDSIIPQENIDAIRYCEENGVTFVLCTGRPVQAIEPFRKILSLDTPVITYNGSRIVDPVSGEVLYQECMSEESASEVIRLAIEYDAVVSVWAEDKLYFNKMTPLSERYVSLVGVKPVMFELDSEYFRGKKINKMVWTLPKEVVQRLLPELTERVPDDISCFTSLPEYIEFVSSRVSKGDALVKLCDRLGIDVSESVAIGDGDNDIEMIAAAGLGVAMSNASAGAKKAADRITVSNDECGVAKIIYDVVKVRE